MAACRRRAASFAGAVLALVVACGGDSAPAPDAGRAPGAAPEHAAAGEAAPEPVRISVHDGRVSLEAHEARRASLLHALAEQAGFELDLGALPASLLTLQLEDVTVEAALAELLRGSDYRCEYRFDAQRDAHVLARVSAGEGRLGAHGLAGWVAEHAAAKAPTPRLRDLARSKLSEKPPSQRWAHPVVKLMPEERERRLEAARAREAQALEQLASASAVDRAAAVEDVDIDGPGRDRVRALASEDPDPAVRSAAVERLSEDESADAFDAMQRALSDPAPQVVRAAIEGLDFRGDAAAIPQLERVATQHPDPEIRELATDAIDSLR
jgi:hypothetical protein